MIIADRSELLVRHLMRFLHRCAGDIEPAATGMIERLIRRTVDGHIAIELRQENIGGEFDVATTRDALLASEIAGTPGDFRPLVLDEHDRLYLYRYWDYERRVADALSARAAWSDSGHDSQHLRVLLEKLFDDERVVRQKTAAAIAALRGLTVVSGGPGTGKTTAVVRMLALLLELDPTLHIALTAPTGKAAARASDAVRSAEQRLTLSDAVRERIPDHAATIHRLLGLRPGYIHFNAQNRLPFDVVVVDEASMVGMSLMVTLLDALRPDCRLILLGDKDQLASVEPGSVLGEICQTAVDYSPGLAAQLDALGIAVENTASQSHALQDNVVRLTHSFRFGAQSGIGRLAEAIRAGDADEVVSLLRDPAIPEVVLHETDSVQQQHELLASRLPDNLRDYLEAVRNRDDPGAILEKFDCFRLLCAFRQGPTGVRGLNSLAEQVLADNGMIDTSDNWYAGRPVMITSNNYTLKLFNGDIGITMRPQDDAEPRVVFGIQDGIRSLHTPRLPAHTTVFAMTVHKSQGSEFDKVALVLPDESSELVGRELIYTAVTRARQCVEIYGRANVLRDAIGRLQQRGSGLADRLRVSPASTPKQRSLF
ncbi:MAG: exodeoxyribonuclease V subunit alpha [Gammaproteobacteria bacterium]|nr:exodeoxyribonuclease V subunit alpha [Gammaproteobacteria bacterium]